MKAVDTLDFWKKRIEDAKKHGKEQFSVYYANDNLWAAIERIHKQLINQIGVNGRVLDAGCGYGRSSEWFKDYTGIDFSPDFIEIAQKKYQNKKFLVADLHSLPFKDKEFDWSVCVSIKHMVVGNQGQEEWDKMEKELKRVSKKLLILEYTEPERYEIV